jgi:hypothetical protein
MARKQLDANGNLSNEYVINEELFAMLDLYLACCFSASSDHARSMSSHYQDRVELYKLMDGLPKPGLDENVHWRRDLAAALNAYVAAFPETAGKKRRSGADFVAIEEEGSKKRALDEL